MMWEKEKMQVTTFSPFPTVFYPKKKSFMQNLLSVLAVLSIWSS